VAPRRPRGGPDATAGLNTMSRVLIIPAAGSGSRLAAGVPKVLAPVNGRPMLDHLLRLYWPHVDRVVCVVRPGVEQEVLRLGGAAGVVLQPLVQAAPTGMLDAILIAVEQVRQVGPDWVWITWCDQVAILPETVDELGRRCAEGAEVGMVVPTVARRSPYIHFDRDSHHRIVGLRQRREGDAMPEVGESDAGLFALSRRACLELLPVFDAETGPGRTTGERNFLPFIPWLSARHPNAVVTFPCRDPREAVGINTPGELREIESWLRERREGLAPGMSA